MSNLKAAISKETFKLALTQCMKKAWVWDSKKNFEAAIKWYKAKKLTFEVESSLEDENDFNDSGVAIDLFDAYLDLENLTPVERTEFELKWNAAWDSSDGFDIEIFKGEAIEDGLEFGNKTQEYFNMINTINNQRNNTKSKTMDLSEFKFNEAEVKTQEALKDANIKYIYEAAFSYDDQKLRAKCDVLKINERNHVEIFEAKATTSVKKEHFFDLVYQAYVLEKNGFIVDNIFIVRINDTYVKNWNFNKIPVNMTFGDYAKYYELNNTPIKFDEIKDLVSSDFIVQDNEEISDLDLFSFIQIDPLSPGTGAERNTLMDDWISFKQTFDLDNVFSIISSYLSIISEDEIPEFLTYDKCITKIEKKKGKNPVFIFSNSKTMDECCFHVMKWFDKYEPGFWNIPKLWKSKKADIILHSPSPYFHDYETLFDVSIKESYKQTSYFANNASAARIFDVYKLKEQFPNNSEKWNIIDTSHLETIKTMLNKYKKFPIYMYDFETSKWAVPRFNKTNSYYQVPFQYSIDVIINDEYDYDNPKTMHHYDFLASQVNVDPRPKFIENFIKDSFKHGPGVYVAYNKSFEQGVLRKLALLFPEYTKPLLYIAQNTIDLMDFFAGSLKDQRPSFLIYHPNFLGSYSIKKTQPSLDPNFSYDDLIINKGDKASETFRKFVDGNIPKAAWEMKIQEGMLKYCNRDTLAMVVILKRINELVKEINE